LKLVNHQQEQKYHLEKIKNQWVKEIPDLTTPHYNEGDDLMAPEVYNKIREIIVNDFLPLKVCQQYSPVVTEMPFYENWEIDNRIGILIEFTDQCRNKPTMAFVGINLRNLIENNIPFTVFYVLSNRRYNHRFPYSHGFYEKSRKGIADEDDSTVMRPEETKLEKQLLDIERKFEKKIQDISDIQQSSKNCLHVEDLIDLSISNNPFDEF